MVRQNESGSKEAQSNLFVDNLRRVVGASYILADSAYGRRCSILAAGYKKEMDALASKGEKDSDRYKELEKLRNGEQKEMVGMGLWASGSVVMSLFGNRSTEKEMRALSKKLMAFLKDEGVELQGDALAKAIEEKNKNLFDKVLDFAYRYPSEIMHAGFVAGSLGIIANGIGKKGKNGEPDKKTDIFTVGQGLVALIGALIGVFVPEKTPAQIAKLPPATNSLQQAGRFVQQHANKATSLFYLSNNGFSFMRMLDDKKKFAKENWSKNNTAEQSRLFHEVWKVRGGALAAYLFGAGVLAATKKTSGGNSDLAKQEMFEEATAIIRAQPPERQEQLIDQVSEYLSQRRELGMAQMDAKSIAAKLHESLGNTPASWVARSQPSSPEGGRSV